MILYSNIFLLLKKKYLHEWKIYTEHTFVKKLSNDKLLEEGVVKIKKVYDKFKDVSVDDKSSVFNTEFIELLELKNLLDNAMATMYGANYRKESRGAHSHEDYPERDDENWLAHTITELKDDEIKLSKREVIRDVLNDEVKPVPLSKRVY